MVPRPVLRRMGELLQWVGHDVQKESTAELAAAGLDVSPAGVAKHLTGLMDAILVETSDLTPTLAAAIAPHVRKSVASSIVMTDDAARLAVARAVLALS